MTRFEVNSGMRRANALRKRRSASPWCWSRRLRSAIQAPLSTNSRAGTAARAIRRPGFGNERLIEVVVEVLTQIGGQAVDVAAELEHWVLGRSACEGSDGGPDHLGPGPPALASARLEPFEVALI